MKEFILTFIRINYKALTGITIGCILGYLFWDSFGIGYGTYPLSSECWANCVYGGLVGGLIVTLITQK